ncbi:MAG: cation transporter [Bacillota bacterium]|nr:cation transporter [Bacillota bacterium]
MKKKFKMQDLDCAHCAAKMEDQIKGLAGVKDANISFMTQKFTLEAEDEKFEEILDAAKKIVTKIEPDCRIITD